jgi:hypothetical protein
MTHQAAAINCDAGQPNAQFAAADAFRVAGRIDLAIQAYKRFIETSPPRGGDPIRSTRREQAQLLIDRLARKGLVLLKSECSKKGGELKCRGRLQNNSRTVVGPVTVELKAWSSDKRPVLLEMGKTELAKIAASGGADFVVAMPIPKKMGAVSITAGGDDQERRFNETPVRF